MALTKIDCDIFRGSNSSFNTSSFSVFNPGIRPGRMAFSGAYAVRESLGSQLACTLAIERFNEAVLNFYSPQNKIGEGDEHLSQLVLETAFKQTNAAVYNFAHKLASGGSMSASVMGAVLDKHSISVGKVGDWSAYLVRENFLYPFFENSAKNKSETIYLGSQISINVETTYVPIQAGDVFLAFSKSLSVKEEKNLIELVAEFNMRVTEMARHITEFSCDKSSDISFSLFSKIGPASIYLEEV